MDDKELAATLARIEARQESIEKTLTGRVVDLEHKVYGNGAEGLVLDVDRLKQDAISRRRALIQNRAAVGSAIVAAISAVIAWVLD